MSAAIAGMSAKTYMSKFASNRLRESLQAKPSDCCLLGRHLSGQQDRRVSGGRNPVLQKLLQPRDLELPIGDGDLAEGEGGAVIVSLRSFVGVSTGAVVVFVIVFMGVL